ncbi:hypothetical protein RhiirC2_791666 [Rhizophagus irregularis]|uniref:Uncharacterized protein n=1 Tax=Rhizophagus irregularis TaxID=588596 RepID=A0A2N1MIR4_9GLOM|nr:hypothetical protein RhiirC2_791666 [Rhizophagus irregularis]
MEVDEEEARVRPKILFQSIKPKYTPRYRQVKSCLSALHKHRRVRLLYKQRCTLDKDNHRLHRNNQLNEKKAHQVKGYSESDEKQPDGKRHINVYNPSWRSEEIYNIIFHHPRGAPNWTYVEQNTLADTDFSELEMLIQMMENLIIAEDTEVSAEMDEIVVIEDSEPMGMEELEPIGVEKSLEMEDETDKWYKFVL